MVGVAQVQCAEGIALVEQDAVVTAVQRQRAEHEVEHLAERQGDHDELHAAGTQRQITHQQRKQRTYQQGQRPHHQRAVAAFPAPQRHAL
ncbi:hypothetical protein FQZ97_1168930 [compost metagenome]